MKRIVILSHGGLPLPPVNGGAVENLIHFLVENNEAKQRTKLVVFSSFNEEAKREANKYINTEFVYIKKYRLLEQIFGFTNRVFRRLRFSSHFQIHPYLIAATKKIKHMECDCVVVENRPEFIPYLRKKMSIPIVLHMHNDYFNRKFYLAEKILKNTDQVLAVSDYVRKNILSINEQASHVHVLRNVVDVEKFTNVPPSAREALRERYGILPSDIVVAYFGRLIPGKGVKELLQALRKVTDNHNDVKMMVVGAAWFNENTETEFVKEIKHLAQNMDGRIIFTGYINYDTIAEYYSCADMVVVPSIIGEATPLTVLEAMAAGKPLIVSDSGGIPEHVDKDCGIEVPRGDDFVEQLANAIDTLIASRELREAMGQKGREHAALYTKDTYLDKMIELL